MSGRIVAIAFSLHVEHAGFSALIIRVENMATTSNLEALEVDLNGTTSNTLRKSLLLCLAFFTFPCLVIGEQSSCGVMKKKKERLALQEERLEFLWCESLSFFSLHKNCLPMTRP